tara:strand:- start:104 stop:307 length:204 start_codon:yes stop_codon:yes gene_type:complete
MLHAMKLSEYLINADLSATRFARRIGVPTSTVTRWLNGVSSPKSPQIEKVRAETRNKVRFEDWLDKV